MIDQRPPCEELSRALELARAQRECLEAGDFESFAGRLNEYESACEVVIRLTPQQLGPQRDWLLQLVADDQKIGSLLVGMKVRVTGRMSALRRAERTAGAYLASPGASSGMRRSA